MDTIRWGSGEVPLLRRPWLEARGIPGFRVVSRLKPGERWLDLPFTDTMYEALVDIDGQAWPVGVVIARELVASGADWALCTDLAPRLALLDCDAVCVEVTGHVADVANRLVASNGGKFAGLPDVIGQTGDALVLREAKREGLDRLQVQQHRFADAARRAYGDDLDLAVVEWAPRDRVM